MPVQDRQKLIHLHRATSGAPLTTDFYFGEIAVNHSSDKPALYIKNNEGIVEFLPATAITSLSNAYADGLIGALDVSAQTIAYVDDGDVIRIYPTITETDGEVLISGEPIVFAKAAKTGKAEDISIEDTGDTFTATTVEAALAELATKMETSTTIDGSGGTFTTSNGLVDNEKVISVKTKDNDYVTVDANGVQLDATQIDSSYDTGSTTNLATVNTVKTAIEDLDVTGYAQGVVANDGTSITIAGLKQDDGKVSRDTDNDVTLNFDGAYNESTNKIATQNTILTAISGLDVTAITGSTNQTITSISEEDGKISATYSDISITTSQISDLENKYAPSGVVTTLIGDDTGKSVRTIANEELASQLIASGASASMDTLQEIAAWIQQHPADASEMNLKITNLEASAHTHDNMDTLDGITAEKVAGWDAASANSHTHNNMEVLTGITAEKVADWDEAAASAHTHANKDLLDTYTQTESDLADAVSKKHEHSNSAVLETITSEKITSWDNAANSAHTHENQTVLDGITSQKVSDWDTAASQTHTHDNSDVLDGITSEKVAGWDEAAASAHTHENASVLDGIDATDVANWDNAYASAHTHDNMEVLSGITSQQVSNWDSAVLGVLNTNSATSANVTVDSDHLLDFSNLSIDCGEY